MPEADNQLTMGDIIAGISVALVLIPQSIAYASLAGLPPIYGIYASIFPPLIAAFFVSSPYLQTGPVAMTSVLTFGAMAGLALPQSSDYIALAALLAILVGIVRVLIGLTRTGFIAYIMSQPVMSGFTAAAAMLIIFSQLPMLLGVPAAEAGILKKALIALSAPSNWSLPAILLGLSTITIIVLGKRLHKLFPGVLLAVVFGIIFSTMYEYSGAVVGELPSSFPQLSISLPWTQASQLIVPALVIALVGFAEPAAIARTMAAKNRQSWSVDKEFISQGAANIASGISGSFPVGGSFSRTMVNYHSGGKSRWSGAITGLSVLAFLPFVSSLAPLPYAVLSAIVISAVYSLVDFKSLYNMLKTSRAQGLVAISTFMLTLALAPQIDLAVLIGITLGVAVHLWRERRVEVESSYAEQTLTLKPVGVLFFGSAPSLNEILIATLAEHPEAKNLILDLQKVGRIDYTGALAIKQIASDAEESGLQVKIIVGRPPQGQRIVTRVIGRDSKWLA